MKIRTVKTHEYVLTKEEMEMVYEICMMCVNRNIHCLGEHQGYYDRIKRNDEFLSGEIGNKMYLDPTEKGGVQE